MKLACLKAGVKIIMLDLISKTGSVINDLMTSSKFYGTNSEAVKELDRISLILEDYGHKVVRKKIETVPWHPAAPQVVGDKIHDNCYFESHIAVVINKDDKFDESMNTLKRICTYCNCHLSRNSFKYSDDTVTQMITLRMNVDYETFNEQLKATIGRLDMHEFSHATPVIEYAFYDTEVSHDDNWIHGEFNG